MKTYDELRPVGKKFVDSYFTKANFPRSPSDPRKYLYAVDRYGRILYRERLTKRAADLPLGA